MSIIGKKEDKKHIILEIYGKSPQKSLANLKQISNEVLPYLFKEKIETTKIELQKKLQAIDETIKIYRQEKNIILDPSSFSDLLQEKIMIQEWLKNPYILKMVTTPQVSQTPVNPNKRLIIIVAFITGLMLSVFMVLLIDAYRSWKSSRQ